MTKPWDDYKGAIIRLYIQEGRTLDEVREIMQRDHGFDASYVPLLSNTRSSPTSVR